MWLCLGYGSGKFLQLAVIYNFIPYIFLFFVTCAFN